MFCFGFELLQQFKFSFLSEVRSAKEATMRQLFSAFMILLLALGALRTVLAPDDRATIVAFLDRRSGLQVTIKAIPIVVAFFVDRIAD